MLLDALPSLFEASRHSAFLYIVSELVKTFGDEPSCEAPLAGLLSRLLHAACGSLPTLERMSESSWAAFPCASLRFACPALLFSAAGWVVVQAAACRLHVAANAGAHVLCYAGFPLHLCICSALL